MVRLTTSNDRCTTDPTGRHPLSHSGLPPEKGGHWICSEDFQLSCDLGRMKGKLSPPGTDKNRGTTFGKKNFLFIFLPLFSLPPPNSPQRNLQHNNTRNSKLAEYLL